MNLSRFFSVLVLTGFLFSALAVPPVQAASSVLSPGDVVRITVYGHSDLETTTRISQEGRITFPLIGDMLIGGKTTSQSERDISQLLGDGGFVKNAQVNIFVEQRSEAVGKSVTILGHVQRSGRYPLQDDSKDGVRTLVDLLASAGGTTNTAADYLFILRTQAEERRKIRVDLVGLLREANLDLDIFLNDSDVIILPEMDVFYIYGQVSKPGRYRLERNMTVMQALSVASGVTDRGSESGVLLNRRASNGDTKTLKTDLDDELKPDDVLYVKDSFF